MIVKAKKMSRLEYNVFRGWKPIENENGEDKGYFIEYSDDYVTWMPEDVFKLSFKKSVNYDKK